MFKYISIPVLLISLSIGILYVYLTKPEQTYIFVYPTPDNVDELLYRDHTDKCFSFEATEVECPSNPKEIESYTVQ